jgi:exonuclease VII small subunit
VEEVAPDAAAKFRDAASEFERVVQAREDSDLDAGLPHWANAVRSVTQGVDELESLTPDSFCKLPPGTD